MFKYGNKKLRSESTQHNRDSKFGDEETTRVPNRESSSANESETVHLFRKPAKNTLPNYGTSDVTSANGDNDLYHARKKHEGRIEQFEEELKHFRHEVNEAKGKGQDVSELEREFQDMMEKLENDKQILKEARAAIPSPGLHEVEKGSDEQKEYRGETADGNSMSKRRAGYLWCCFLSCFLFLAGVFVGWWLTCHFEVVTYASPTPAPNLILAPTMMPTAAGTTNTSSKPSIMPTAFKPSVPPTTPTKKHRGTTSPSSEETMMPTTISTKLAPTMIPTAATNLPTTPLPTIPRYLRTFNPTIPHKSILSSSEETTTPTDIVPTMIPLRRKHITAALLTRHQKLP